jgi:hypothetical protein
MGNLTSAIQELRAERKQAQARVESIDQAISVIESLNGSRTFHKANQPTRIISAASRRKMAQAQRARWARARKESQPTRCQTMTAAAGIALDAAKNLAAEHGILVEGFSKQRLVEDSI